MLRRKIAIKNNGGAKSNKERCIVLLLAGSIYDNSNGGVKIVHHRRRNYEYSGSDLRLDTFLWERDLRALSTLFERSGATVWKCAGTSKRCSKRVVLDLIRNFFNYDNVERLRDAYAQTTTFLLYWCGHSDLRTDNWGFSEEGEITCRDLINIWYEAQRRTDDAITIFADTCRSGVWIDELKAARIPNLAYQAACRANEAAFLVYDRKVPRSLLMRRVFREYLSEPSTTRTCTSQHPIYLCDYASSQEEEGGDTESSTLVRGSFRLFTIRFLWYSNNIAYQEEQKRSCDWISMTIAGSGIILLGILWWMCVSVGCIYWRIYLRRQAKERARRQIINMVNLQTRPLILYHVAIPPVQEPSPPAYGETIIH